MDTGAQIEKCLIEADEHIELQNYANAGSPSETCAETPRLSRVHKFDSAHLLRL